MEGKIYIKPGQRITITIEVLPEVGDRNHEAMALDDILAIISDTLELPMEALKAKTRRRQVVYARHLFSHIATKVYTHSAVDTGRFLNQDHTTILHSQKVVSDLIDTNDTLMMGYLRKVQRQFNVQLR